jgi:hypothetical protein
LPPSAGFLLGLLFDPEDGGDMFPRNVGLSSKYRTEDHTLQINRCIKKEMLPSSIVQHFCSLLKGMPAGAK